MIIHLNGTSSSGKTSIAHELQRILGPEWLHSGIDHYLERVAPGFHTESSDPDADAPGLLWLMDPEGRRVTSARWGPVGLRMVQGMYRAGAAYAAAGNNLIFDDVMFDDRATVTMREAFADVEVFLVAVKCPLEELERRETARGNRVPGSARVQFEPVHAGQVYDFEIDTSQQSPDESAQKIVEAIRA